MSHHSPWSVRDLLAVEPSDESNSPVSSPLGFDPLVDAVVLRDDRSPKVSPCRGDVAPGLTCSLWAGSLQNDDTPRKTALPDPTVAVSDVTDTGQSPRRLHSSPDSCGVRTAERALYPKP